ncbi:ZN532-like protein [Mya arenaria]|uniref:ZN532-like protein n=1 Tax=Mya arenaria TaxID=6604 RepID=A0ABY7DVI0_MYAAR|nr:zinc finger protein 532-like [Mya arenaria]XP_052793059.1 zinc finger protein 532-like [Mya arenaria]WAR00872.1 ZN532-like protein [Mya arenaria]
MTDTSDIRAPASLPGSGCHGNTNLENSRVADAPDLDGIDSGYSRQESDDFSGMIAETEAAMREKLSQLTMPDSSALLDDVSNGRNQHCGAEQVSYEPGDDQMLLTTGQPVSSITADSFRSDTCEGGALARSQTPNPTASGTVQVRDPAPTAYQTGPGIPADDKPACNLASSENVPRPSVQENNPRPSVQENNPRHSVQENNPRPSVQENNPRHSVEENVPRPSVEEDNPRPSVQDSNPRPSVEENVPRPSVEKNVPRPSVEANDPHPSVEENVPGPSVEENVPRPSVQENVPRPSVEENVHRPSVEENDPRPSVEEATIAEQRTDNVVRSSSVLEIEKHCTEAVNGVDDMTKAGNQPMFDDGDLDSSPCALTIDEGAVDIDNDSDKQNITESIQENSVCSESDSSSEVLQVNSGSKNGTDTAKYKDIASDVQNIQHETEIMVSSNSDASLGVESEHSGLLEHPFNENIEKLVSKEKECVISEPTMDNVSSTDDSSECLMITNVVSLSEMDVDLPCDRGSASSNHVVSTQENEVSDNQAEDHGIHSAKSSPGQVCSGVTSNNSSRSQTPSDSDKSSVSGSNGKTESSNGRRKRKPPPSKVRKVTDKYIGFGDGADLDNQIEHQDTNNKQFQSSAGKVKPTSKAHSEKNTNLQTNSLSENQSTTDSSNAGNLPVITNAFSLAPSLAPSVVHPVLVKSEPLDEGSYGQFRSKPVPVISRNQVPVLARSVPAPQYRPPWGRGQPLNVHSGRKVGSGPSRAPKLVLSKAKGNPQVVQAMARVGPGSEAPQFPVQVIQMGNVRHSVPLQLMSSANNAIPVQSRASTAGQVISVPVNSAIPVQSGATAGRLLSAPATSTAITIPWVPPINKPLEPGKQVDDCSRLETINVHSVGVTKITDLIARKNPIPTYKAPEPPAGLKNDKRQTFSCYECGDMFYFEKSLDIHMGRCSMKLKYKCEKCNKMIDFTNKCQLLSHLRSHLNIAKTQAVPIHIKSDSIEIKTFYDDIKPNENFEWYKLDTGYVQKEKTCPECRQFLYKTAAEIKAHFQGDGDASGKYSCSNCVVICHSKCGLKAHERIHNIIEMKNLYKDQKLEFIEKSLLTFVCPECGFMKSAANGTATTLTGLQTLEAYFEHVMSCLHFGMFSMLHCSKCKVSLYTESSAMKHIYANMEHYYKCDECPMALKSVKNLETHFKDRHTGFPKAKIIYRCHVCSTLIDDHNFLIKHMKEHYKELSESSKACYCIICGSIVSKDDDMKTHRETHLRLRNHLYCRLCRKASNGYVEIIEHMFDEHLAKNKFFSENQLKLCKVCGLLCHSVQKLNTHVCLQTVLETKVTKPSTVIPRPIMPLPAPERNETNCSEQGNKTKYMCNHCKKEFKSLPQKVHHLRSHYSEKIYICYVCDKSFFSDSKKLKSHQIACAALKKLKEGKPDANVGKLTNFPIGEDYVTDNASEAEYEGEDMEDLEEEISLKPQIFHRTNMPESKVTEYRCEECPLVFTRKSKQEEHMNAEHGLHPCHLCGVMHNSSKSLKRHLMMDHEGKRVHYPCLLCRQKKVDKFFSIKFMLLKHLRSKHKMKSIDESKIVAELPGLPGVPCDSVDMETSSYTSPEGTPEPPIKKLRVEGEDVFKCAKCLFTAEKKSTFKDHIAEHRTPNTFQCYECGLCFSVLPSLRKHLFMVHKVKDFEKYLTENKIEDPAENVDSDDDIEREPVLVDPEPESESEEESANPLECKVCYREFETERQLHGHMRVHGMAFIKKSRRRGQTSPQKVESEEMKANSEGRKCDVMQVARTEGLVMKIKKAPSEQRAVDEESEPKKRKVSENGEN